MSPGARADTFVALGTEVYVGVVDGDALDRALVAVHSEMDAIDRACSRFRDDSELSLLNTAGGASRVISPLFVEALAAALRAAELTDGLVDPTVGQSLCDLGYDVDFLALDLDDPRPIGRLMPAPGWRRVRLHRTLGLVEIPAGVRLDLGATAKALAADRAARAAFAATGCGVLVNCGGDLAITGEPPADGWTIRVTDDSDRSSAAEFVNLHDGGMATSGVTARRWLRAGRECHHIVDPRTGAPATTRWSAVTVTAASCLDANIAATAAILLGDDAPSWLMRQGLAARLVADDGSVTRICGWPDRIEEAA